MVTADNGELRAGSGIVDNTGGVSRYAVKGKVDSNARRCEDGFTNVVVGGSGGKGLSVFSICSGGDTAVSDNNLIAGGDKNVRALNVLNYAEVLAVKVDGERLIDICNGSVCIDGNVREELDGCACRSGCDSSVKSCVLTDRCAVYDNGEVKLSLALSIISALYKRSITESIGNGYSSRSNRKAFSVPKTASNVCGKLYGNAVSGNSNTVGNNNTVADSGIGESTACTDLDGACNGILIISVVTGATGSDFTKDVTLFKGDSGILVKTGNYTVGFLGVYNNTIIEVSGALGSYAGIYLIVLEAYKVCFLMVEVDSCILNFCSDVIVTADPACIGNVSMLLIYVVLTAVNVNGVSVAPGVRNSATVGVYVLKVDLCTCVGLNERAYHHTCLVGAVLLTCSHDDSTVSKLKGLRGCEGVCFIKCAIILLFTILLKVHSMSAKIDGKIFAYCDMRSDGVTDIGKKLNCGAGIRLANYVNERIITCCGSQIGDTALGVLEYEGTVG